MQDLFKDWVDIDLALFYIAIALGVMKPDTSHEAWIQVKGVFNTRNAVSDSMFVVFEELKRLEVLEETDTGLVRWNSRHKQGDE